MSRPVPFTVELRTEAGIRAPTVALAGEVSDAVTFLSPSAPAWARITVFDLGVSVGDQLGIRRAHLGAVRFPGGRLRHAGSLFVPKGPHEALGDLLARLAVVHLEHLALDDVH